MWVGLFFCLFFFWGGGVGGGGVGVGGGVKELKFTKFVRDISAYFGKF